MNELQIKVAQAVHVLNHDAQSANRVAANQWLVQFQHTRAAWDVAASLLTSSDHLRFVPSPDFEVEFFAAQILRRKIQNEGYYLQLGAKDALLNALLVGAKRFSVGPPQDISGELYRESLAPSYSSVSCIIPKPMGRLKSSTKV